MGEKHVWEGVKFESLTPKQKKVYDSTYSVFTVAAIATKENPAVATINYPSVFLNSDMPLEGDHVVYMRIDIFLTKMLNSIEKSYQNLVNTNDTCVVVG